MNFSCLLWHNNCVSYKDGAKCSQFVKKIKFKKVFLNLSCLIDRSSPSISEDASKFLNQITSPRRKTNHTQRPFIEVKQYFFLRFLWWKNWKIGCWLNRKSLWHCPRSLLKWLFIPLFVLFSRSRLDGSLVGAQKKWVAKTKQPTPQKHSSALEIKRSWKKAFPWNGL